MMALDGKTIIKEEIPDKEVYETTTNNNNRRLKSANGSKDNCRSTPDSPESARAIAPRSPMSPQIHHSSSSSSLAPPLPLQRPNRNASSSPVVNGATTTPPPLPPSSSSSQSQQQTTNSSNNNGGGGNGIGSTTGSITGGNGSLNANALASASLTHLEQTRALCKIRRFFGSLIQFGQEAHPESSDRIRALTLSLASGGISIDEFRITLQEATNYPLRPYVLPFLKSHIPLLQREIAAVARSNNQTTLQYVTTNDTCVMEFTHGPPDHPDIFLPMETAPNPLTINGNTSGGGGGGGGGSSNSSNNSNNGLSGLVFKRRPSDTLMDHSHNGGSIQDWNDYIYPPAAKRHYSGPGDGGRPGGGGSGGGSSGGGGGPTSNNAGINLSNSNPSHGPSSIHLSATNSTANNIFNSQHSSLFEYQHAAAAAAAAVNSFQRSVGENESFGSLLDKSSSHRISDERDLRIGGGSISGGGGVGIGGIGSLTESQRITTNRMNNICNSSAGGGGGGGGGSSGGVGGGVGSSGEEEWKNIHTMLNCISAMVDKTKRAITILQQRGVDPQQPNILMSVGGGGGGGTVVGNNNYTAEIAAEIRRQTEEKVAELKRNAEEAVNQVKRQAVIEIQRAVAAAENRAADIMAQERLKMEKFFVDMTRHTGDSRDIENKSPSLTTGQSACWNCGRKANETCSGCNMARYCGAFCQHKDWEHHHQICGNARSDVTGTSGGGCPPRHSSVAAVAVAAAAAAAAVRQGQIARSPPTSVVTNRDRDITTTGGQNSVTSSGGGGNDRNNNIGNSTQSTSNNSIQNGVNTGGGNGSIPGSK